MLRNYIIVSLSSLLILCHPALGQEYVSTPQDVFRNFEFHRELPGNFKPHGYAVVSSQDGHPVRQGSNAIRVEVRPGDCGHEYDGSWSDCEEDRERHEVRSQAFSGTNFLYFSVYFPQDFEFMDNAVNQSIAQIYPDTNGLPDPHGGPFMIIVGGGDRLIIKNEVLHPRSLQTISDNIRGRWTDILLYANWTDKDDGFLYVFVNGSPVPVYAWRGATLFKGYQDANFKFGIYRSFISRSNAVTLPTQTLYYDAISLSSDCMEDNLSFNCASIYEAQRSDPSPVRTCDGAMCPTEYKRSAADLLGRFECFIQAKRIEGAEKLPTDLEINNFINNIQGVDTYRNKRHIVALGLSQEIVDEFRPELLRLVNYTGDVVDYCNGL